MQVKVLGGSYLPDLRVPSLGILGGASNPKGTTPKTFSYT